MDEQKVMDAVRVILESIGEDPDRAGIQDTPRRVAKFWREFTEYEAGTLATSFSSEAVDQMVVVSGIRVWSLCEHHLLPFWADISIGYIAKDKILGLSKFARIAHKHAHGLQVQERLVQQIANTVGELTGSPDVAVIAKGVHTCMAMRGIKTDGVMTSSVMSGIFREDASARAEFLGLAK